MTIRLKWRYQIRVMDAGEANISREPADWILSVLWTTMCRIGERMNVVSGKLWSIHDRRQVTF